MKILMITNQAVDYESLAQFEIRALKLKMVRGMF